MTAPLIESAAKELAKWQSAFTPRRFLRNGHLQTLAGNFFPRTAVLPPPENELIEVEAAHEAVPSSRVLCQSHWQPEAGSDTVLLLHGLEGSSNSQYVRGNGARFYAAGWNVVRMNMRNCGGTERECATLYHSGLSADVLAVVRHYQRTRDAQRWSLVGYSMGGNLVLKMLAEGNSVKEIACDLNLSVKTVEAHKFNLMRKLDIHNKAQLVQYAIQKKIIKIPNLA